MVDPASSSPAGSPLPTLVTGCSSGIGRAIALRLAAAGWPVYASARRLESIAGLADPAAYADEADEADEADANRGAGITSRGCQLLELDVTDPGARRAAISRIESDHGAVGAIVNNAGFGQQGPLEETPLEAMRAQFETNVFGAVGLIQLALPGMRRAGFGRIVNLSSMGGRLTFPGGAAYHGSKYALEAMSDVLRFEVAGFGIKVVVIEPGPTASDFGEASLDSMNALEIARDDAYRPFRAGIRSALEATFTSPPAGATTAEAVADSVWHALTDAEPEPRVIVGDLATQLIERKESSSAGDWDALVAGMYPQPGRPGEND